jgi:hypothetical protein
MATEILWATPSKFFGRPRGKVGDEPTRFNNQNISIAI